MDSMRAAAANTTSQQGKCCRCAATGPRWDRIAGKEYCPNCQESLAQGEAPPLVERTEKRPCAACGHIGTVCYRTLPRERGQAVEIDLCPEHLRALLGRRLGPNAFYQLRRRLGTLGLDTEELFLLHGAFYDGGGRALQPALETE